MFRRTWIHRTRQEMIAPGRSQTEINAVRTYPVPLVPYHPTAVRKRISVLRHFNVKNDDYFTAKTGSGQP